MEAGRGGQREKGVNTPFWAVAVLILGAQENWKGLLGRIFQVSPGPFLGLVGPLFGPLRPLEFRRGPWGPLQSSEGLLRDYQWLVVEE